MHYFSDSIIDWELVPLTEIRDGEPKIVGVTLKSDPIWWVLTICRWLLVTWLWSRYSTFVIITADLSPIMIHLISTSLLFSRCNSFWVTPNAIVFLCHQPKDEFDWKAIHCEELMTWSVELMQYSAISQKSASIETHDFVEFHRLVFTGVLNDGHVYFYLILSFFLFHTSTSCCRTYMCTLLFRDCKPR